MVSLNEVVIKGEKKHGPGTYAYGSECQMDFYRVPTGVFAVDYMLGGGFPVGVTSSIYGPPGGGKTLLLTLLAAGGQNICWSCYNYLWDCSCNEHRPQKVVVVQTEKFDMGFAVLLGLTPESVVIAEVDSGEQASDIIIDCLRADDCGLVLLDSLPMLTPTVELEASALDVQVAAQAKLITKMIRRIKSVLIKEKKKHHPVAFVCTNQVRAKIGGFGGFGPQETQPGGYASKHDWHVTVRIAQRKSDNIDKETELPIDAKFKASIVAMGNKRKVFTLSGASEFHVTVSNTGAYMKGTVNDFKTTVRYAESVGVLQRDPWKFGAQEYDKKGDIIEEWEDTQAFLSAKKVVVDAYIVEAKDILNVEDCDAEVVDAQL